MIELSFSFDSQSTDVRLELDVTLMRQILAHADARVEHHGRELDSVRIQYTRWNDEPKPERNVIIGVYKHGEREFPVDESGLIGWPEGQQ